MADLTSQRLRKLEELLVVVEQVHEDMKTWDNYIANLTLARPLHHCPLCEALEKLNV